MNRLRDMYDKDLTPEKNKKKQKKLVIVFDGSSGNLIMNMLKYISESYEGDARTYICRDGIGVVSS